jgi:hypothetical protein
MSEERDAYQAYLLRLWRVPCQGRWQWRASLENPQSAERQLFAGLEQLFAFVEERCDGQQVELPPVGRWADRETADQDRG